MSEARAVLQKPVTSGTTLGRLPAPGEGFPRGGREWGPSKVGAQGRGPSCLGLRVVLSRKGWIVGVTHFGTAHGWDWKGASWSGWPEGLWARTGRIDEKDANKGSIVALLNHLSG